MSDTVIVAAFVWRHEAEVAAGFLQDEGITAGVFADDAGGLHPGLGFSRDARVIVPADQAERAREVLIEAGVIEG